MLSPWKCAAAGRLGLRSAAVIAALLPSLALAQVGSPATVPAPAQPRDVVVTGKLVCTSVRVTGSRVARARRCVTAAQAAEEREQSREAMRQGGAHQHSTESLACGGSSIQSCN